MNRKRYKMIASIVFISFALLGIILGFIAAKQAAGIIPIPRPLTQPKGDTLQFTIIFLAGSVVGLLVGWMNYYIINQLGTLTEEVQKISQPTHPGKPTWMR